MDIWNPHPHPLNLAGEIPIFSSVNMPIETKYIYNINVHGNYSDV
jgi:hypothetical protein